MAEAGQAVCCTYNTLGKGGTPRCIPFAARAARQGFAPRHPRRKVAPCDPLLCGHDRRHGRASRGTVSPRSAARHSSSAACPNYPPSRAQSDGAARKGRHFGPRPVADPAARASNFAARLPCGRRRAPRPRQPGYRLPDISARLSTASRARARTATRTLLWRSARGSPRRWGRAAAT